MLWYGTFSGSDFIYNRNSSQYSANKTQAAINKNAPLRSRILFHIERCYYYDEMNNDDTSSPDATFRSNLHICTTWDDIRSINTEQNLLRIKPKHFICKWIKIDHNILHFSFTDQFSCFSYFPTTTLSFS